MKGEISLALDNVAVFIWWVSGYGVVPCVGRQATYLQFGFLPLLMYSRVFSTCPV